MNRCNLSLIFDIIKLYNEEAKKSDSHLFTNKADKKMSTYWKNNYVRILYKEINKCINSK